MTSPARAGNTLLAANPTAVARKTLPKVGAPQRLEQVLPAPRAHQQIDEHRRQRQRQPLRARAHESVRPHPPQIDVVQKQRDEQRRASASTTTVRMWERMNRERLYYSCSLGPRALSPLHVVVVSWPAPACKIPGFAARGNPLPAASPLLQTTLADRPPDRQGKVRDHLRFRRSPADRRHRSHLRLRLRARLGHSRQGQGPDADLGVLVRRTARDRAQPRAVARPG